VLQVSTAVSETAPEQFFPPYFGLGLVQLLFRVLCRDPPSHDLVQSFQSDQSPKGFHPPSTEVNTYCVICFEKSKHFILENSYFLDKGKKRLPVMS